MTRLRCCEISVIIRELQHDLLDNRIGHLMSHRAYLRRTGLPVICIVDAGRHEA